VLAATEIYVGLTTERADRPPFSPEDAAAELRRLESDGVLEPRASRAVLVAAGHGEPRRPRGQAAAEPGGLTRREVDVLRLAARGLTTRQIADRLFISPKTADHHIQHIYGKIGVSTRAAAALWAMQLMDVREGWDVEFWIRGMEAALQHKLLSSRVSLPPVSISILQ
jgi:DNA-binding CsgD family transcriptional regulator